MGSMDSYKKEVKEIGCVLADYTDTQSSVDESVPEQESPNEQSNLETQTMSDSMSITYSSFPPLSSSSEIRSFLVGDDLELSENPAFSAENSTPSEADLISWNTLLYDYLSKDC